MQDKIDEIFSSAVALAELLKSTEEYVFYMNAKDRLLSVPESAERLADYRSELAQMQMQNMMGADNDEELQAFDEYAEVLWQDELIADYLHAESLFFGLVQEIQVHMNDVLQLWDNGEDDFPFRSSEQTILN